MMRCMETARPSRIVILGGGFAGLYTALHLERMWKRDPREVLGKRIHEALDISADNPFRALYEKSKRENEPSVYELDAKAVEELQKTASEVKEFQPPKTDTKKK